jgi:hypothetical protein
MNRQLDDRGVRLRQNLKTLMENPLFDEAIKDIKQDILVEIMSSEPKEVQKREYGYQQFHTVDKIVGKLNAYVGDLVMLKEVKNG